MRRLLLLLLALPVASVAQTSVPAASLPPVGRGEAVVVDSAFTTASDTLTTGEYKHVVEVAARAGDRIVAGMSSRALDPYLIVRSPTGAQAENDDCAPGERAACLDWVADTTGTFRVIATTYAPGETGPFRLAVRVAPPGYSERGVQCPAPGPASDGAPGEIEYAVLFAPDGSYLSSGTRASAPALQVAVDRVIAGCRADALPADAPQIPQATPVTFRVPAAP